MANRSEKYNNFIFIGMVIIALGIVFSTTLQDTVGSLGTLLIAVGGLFLIIGMSKKRR